MKKRFPRWMLWLPVLLASMGPMALAGGLPRGDAREAGFSPEKLANVRAMLERAVAESRISGGVALVARRGKVVELDAIGRRDVESGAPMDESTIFRIASMTKPITSAAVLMLYDEGKLRLDDPVSKYLPEFRAMRVLAASDQAAGLDAPASTVPAQQEITIEQLLTHTSGLSYRFFDRPRIAPLYVEAAVSDGLSETPGTIGDNVKRLARLPLLHQPGTTWEYSLSTDVLGRLIEVVSGQTLDKFFRERIFTPLKMTDTHFLLPREKRDRLATLYEPSEDQTIRRTGNQIIQNGPLVYSGTYPVWDDGHYFSGGAGLVSTIGDYARFLQMLLNGGTLDGARLLKPETVERMTSHRLGDLRIEPWGHGDGFGYGFGVVTERGKSEDRAPVGSYSWGGFFYTYFWVDPRNEIIGILMTQTYPSGHLTLREGLKAATYEAIVDE